jgi:hypothetical protein
MLAEHLSNGSAEPDGACLGAAAMEEILSLAARMVGGGNERIAKRRSGYVSAVNRLCRDLLVVGLLEEMGLR